MFTMLRGKFADVKLHKTILLYSMKKTLRSTTLSIFFLQACICQQKYFITFILYDALSPSPILRHYLCFLALKHYLLNQILHNFYIMTSRNQIKHFYLREVVRNFLISKMRSCRKFVESHIFHQQTSSLMVLTCSQHTKND